MTLRVENCPPITPHEAGAVRFDDADLAQIAGVMRSLPGKRVLWIELGRLTVWVRSLDIPLDDDPEAVRLQKWAQDCGRIGYSTEIADGARASFGSLAAALAGYREQVLGLTLAAG